MLDDSGSGTRVRLIEPGSTTNNLNAYKGVRALSNRPCGRPKPKTTQLVLNRYPTNQLNLPL